MLAEEKQGMRHSARDNVKKARHSRQGCWELGRTKVIKENADRHSKNNCQTEAFQILLLLSIFSYF